MMDRYSGIFLIIHLIKVSEGYIQSCNASLETVEQVSNCPTSNASYVEAARRKNCSSLPLDKTGCQSFQYHCVLSDDLNAILEVCAPSIKIIDYVCTKFSSTFKSIMRVDDQSCGNSTPRCPYSYNSTLAFLYQQCYTNVYGIPTTEFTPSSTPKGLSTKGLENSEDQGWIAAAVIVPIVLITVIVIGIIFCVRYKRKRGHQHDQQIRANGIEMDTVVNRADNENENHMHLLLPENEEIEHDENRRAMLKTVVSTEVEHKKLLLQSAVNSLIKCLKYPNNDWTKEKIKGEIDNLLNEIQIAGDREILMQFVEILNEDPQIQMKLTDCEAEMHLIFLDILHKYDATELSIDKGCVCFTITFSDDQALTNFFRDFQQRDEDFIKCISRILLNKNFLGIFQIHPKIVTWKAFSIKTFKGSELLQEESPEVPVVGGYTDTKEVTSEKENPKESTIDGLFRFAKFAIAVAFNLTQIYRDVLEKEIPPTSVDSSVKSSNLYGKLSQKEKHDLNRAVQSGYSELNIPFMYKLIRHMSLKIPKPTKNWGVMPTSEDVSVGDDIERIRYFQFCVFKEYATLSEESFNEHWTNISEICQRMQRFTGENYLKSLEKIHELSLEELEKGVVKLKSDEETEKLSEFREHEVLQEVKPSTRVIGTLKDSTNIQGEESTGESKLGGMFRFIKLVMTVETLTLIYRDLLEMEIPHSSIEIKVKSSTNIYKRLTQMEMDIIKKAVHFGYSEFYIPLIYKLMRGIGIKIYKPTRGWGDIPTAADVSIGDDIERIRCIRNNLIHSTTKSVPRESFDAYWTDIYNICQRMKRHTGKNYMNDLQLIHEFSMGEVEKEVSKLMQEIQADKELIGKLNEEDVLDDFHSTTNSFPAYKHVQTRKKSFEGCKISSIKDRAWDFARDGFYYEGYDLETTCFHCGVHKGDWKEEDDIHGEHKSLKQECEFVKYVQ